MCWGIGYLLSCIMEYVKKLFIWVETPSLTMIDSKLDTLFQCLVDTDKWKVEMYTFSGQFQRIALVLRRLQPLLWLQKLSSLDLLVRNFA